MSEIHPLIRDLAACLKANDLRLDLSARRMFADALEGLDRDNRTCALFYLIQLVEALQETGESSSASDVLSVGVAADKDLTWFLRSALRSTEAQRPARAAA